MYKEEQPQVPYPGSKLDGQSKKNEDFIASINAILNKDKGKETENELLDMLTKQRTLLLDVASAAFINKPGNSKLLDSISTILGHMEKTVRDNRKERMKDKEMEDNRANFATFVNALQEVASGKLTLPTYETAAFILDPNKSLFDLDIDSVIVDGELEQGRQELNAKEIEDSFED